MDDWLPLTCSFCEAKFRIRKEYAHLRGRCPACGFRIAAPFPLPYVPPVHVSDSDEPLGLLPIDEEWPEPARLGTQDEAAVYNYSAKPTIPNPPPAPSESESPREIFKLADEKAHASPPAAAASPPPVVTPYKLGAELGDAPPAFPPARPAPPA